MQQLDSCGALRKLPYMGVIYVVAEAEKLGFYNGHPDWCNLGQGQPEVGPMAGAPPRFDSLELRPEDHAYGPIHGTVELREMVAEHYNRLFRTGKKSLYTRDNVAIAAGGRLALSRAMYALARGAIGYQLPDYTAYEDMLSAQMPRITPVPFLTEEEHGFAMTTQQLTDGIQKHKLSGFLISNPCNPTGHVIKGDELATWADIARNKSCTLFMDEFYSHFIYDHRGNPGKEPVSIASYIDDVNRDPVMIFDGLTKNYRYPGWRLGWVVGPKSMIECMITAGSSLDGGPSRVVQRAAREVLRAERADQETTALREVFAEKRKVMLEGLKSIGVRFAKEPDSTFYVWGCIDKLPAPFNDADTFFRKALELKVMTVPGRFFDVNPGKARTGTSPFASWMRFSYGPNLQTVKTGIARLQSLVG